MALIFSGSWGLCASIGIVKKVYHNLFPLGKKKEALVLQNWQKPAEIRISHEKFL
jgi:hypothetical protein